MLLFWEMPMQFENSCLLIIHIMMNRFPRQMVLFQRHRDFSFFQRNYAVFF